MHNHLKSYDDIVFTSTQEDGSSQATLYCIIKEILGTEMHQQSENFTDAKKTYVYIDDGVYTGKRFKKDVNNLLEQLPRGSKLAVFCIFAYSNSYYYWKENLRKAAQQKGIRISFCCSRIFYNERGFKAESIDFLWPSRELQSNEEVLLYGRKLANTGKAFHPYYNERVYGHDKGMFSSYEAEKRVCSAFLKQGLKICGRLNATTFKPLGFSNTASFGFGSFVATDFNISNTAPLVLWWGSLDECASESINCWYPLLPRRDNRTLYQYVEQQERKLAINTLKPILQTVYHLALAAYEEERQRAKKQKRDEMGIIKAFDDFDLDEYYEERRQSELLNYLIGRDFDEIKAIETVMYIGRDYDENLRAEYEEAYNDSYSNLERHYPVENPDAVLYEWMNFFDASKGWNSKATEADMIYGKKLKLYRYLEDAFNILGVRY